MSGNLYPTEWKFHPERKGKQTSIYDCYYCGLEHKEVECGGIHYCPNPHCNGPGGTWFRAKLKSFKELPDNRHTVDELEWKTEADAYMARGMRFVTDFRDILAMEGIGI